MAIKSNSIALITKYSPEILDEIFAKEAVTTILERNSGLLKFTSAKTVLIPSIEMDGLGDYTKITTAGPNAYGYSQGGVDITWESHTLTKDRGKQFVVDTMDDEETAGLVVGNLLDQFVRLKEVPEVDAYRLSTLFSKAYADQVVEETISANQIISKFNDAFEKFADLEIPEDEQILYVSNQVMTLIRNTTELNKRLNVEDYTSPAGISFTVEKYEGRPIIPVPKSRFFTAYNFHDNGFTPVAGAKQMNFMLVHFNAALPIKKHQVLKTFGPEVVQDFDGFKMNHRLYHDIFVPKNKRVAIFVSVSGTSASLPLVSFVSTAGAVTNASIISDIYAQGVRGTLVYKLGDNTLTAAAPGDALTTANGWVVMTLDANYAQTIAMSTSTNIVVAVKDPDTEVALASSATTVANKGA
jgi:hypothetical protein